MGNCRLDEPLMAQRYYDGELDPDDARAFEAHLAACADCQRALEELRTLSSFLEPIAGLEGPTVAPGQFAARARSLQLQRSRRVAWGLVAAASILLAGSLFLVGYTETEPSEPMAMMPWEANVVAAPSDDEELVDMDTRTLVAIHIQEPAPGRTSYE